MASFLPKNVHFNDKNQKFKKYDYQIWLCVSPMTTENSNLEHNITDSKKRKDLNRSDIDCDIH